jgi:hypothetical protein
MSDTCKKLHEAFSALPRFGAGYENSQVPANGIYIVFEKGEKAHGTDRIVGVGTHTGEGNLSQRLNEHLYTPNKDRSIFRKHIGRCLLAAENNPLLEQWNLDTTSKAMREKHGKHIDTKALAEIESRVSAYITNSFSFTVIAVASKKDRLALKSGLLSTIASCAVCKPSAQWLGLHHPNATIRHAGLWNIQHLDDTPLSAETVDLICSASAVRVPTSEQPLRSRLNPR